MQDDIHRWSTGLPDWQRDLLRRLTRGPLTRDEEREVLAILLGASDAPAPRVLELADLPLDEPEAGPLELEEISDVENVNLLANGQALRFRPGLNVIFGPTGAGKSGYGRLLRWLCGSGEPPKILPDVFDADAKGKPQTVSVCAVVGGETRDIAVDLAGKPHRALSAMTVFDAVSARPCVSGPNVVEHVPRPLRLLRQAAEAQHALAGRLKEKAASLRDELPPLPEIDPATPAGQLVAAVGAESDPVEIERFATLSEDERAELKELGATLTALSLDQDAQMEAAGRARARDAAIAADELQAAGEKLADERIEAIGALRARLDEATAAERALATDTFSGQQLANTGQGPWRAMWDAARRCVEADGGEFPSTQPGAACPLCQQSLDEAARARMAKFEEFVRGDLRRRVAALAEELERETGALPDVEALGALVEALLSGAEEEVTSVAREAIAALASRAERARHCAEGCAVEAPRAAPLPSVAPIRAFARDQAAAAEALTGFRDEERRQRLTGRLAELRARDELAAALPAVREHIAALTKSARVKTAVRALNTTKLSNYLHKLQEAVVTDRLCSAVAEELGGFRLLEGRVSFVGKAARGRSAIQVWLTAPGKVKLDDVLSDGEQRALALAFFLAESSVSGSRSAIVMDDPVVLLDRVRQEYLVRRLVEEAQRRQVIVFTHDLRAVHMFQQFAEAAGQKPHCQALQQGRDRVGITGAALATR